MMFKRHEWFRNPAIWLIESTLAYISGTAVFPNMGFVQEYSKWTLVIDQTQKNKKLNFQINSNNPISLWQDIVTLIEIFTYKSRYMVL